MDLAIDLFFDDRCSDWIEINFDFLAVFIPAVNLVAIAISYFEFFDFVPLILQNLLELDLILPFIFGLSGALWARKNSRSTQRKNQ